MQMRKKVKMRKRWKSFKGSSELYGYSRAAQERNCGCRALYYGGVATADRPGNRFKSAFKPYSKYRVEVAMKSEGGVRVARQGLSDKYQSLNNLVGYKPEERPLLIDRPEFTPININNLEAEIQRRIELSPSIWLAERQIELAKLDLDLYDWANPMREPYDAKKIDVNTAELQSADGKEQMRQGMRTIYNNIMQLEENYSLLQQNLKIAEENLRIAQLQYEVGTATKSQVLEAELKVAQAKKDIATVVYTHEVLKLRFDKPWAMAA